MDKKEKKTVTMLGIFITVGFISAMLLFFLQNEKGPISYIVMAILAVSLLASLIIALALLIKKLCQDTKEERMKFFKIMGAILLLSCLPLLLFSTETYFTFGVALITFSIILGVPYLVLLWWRARTKQKQGVPAS